jgi:hypothetical protein
MIQIEIKQENNNENQPLDNEENPKIRCNVCGSWMWRNNYRRHINSKKHKDCIYALQDMLEVK